MAQFYYEARSKGKTSTGIIEEKDKNKALILLRRQRMQVLKLKRASKKQLEAHGVRVKEIQIVFGPFGKVGHKDLMQFTKKLATMVRSGLGIVDAIEMVVKQTKHPVFKDVQYDILEDLNQGVNLVDAFKRHPKVFDNVYVNMLAAGEITGELDKFLDRLSDMLEKRQKIIAGIKKALFYPITLIVVAVAITIFMLTNVVPTFEKMYASLGVELPGPTQVIVNTSRYILDPINASKIVGMIFVFVFVFKMLRKIAGFDFFIYKLTLKLPLFGNIIVQGIVARISLLMANLVTAGIGIIEVLDICRTTTNNRLFVTAFDRIKEGLYGGQPISVMFAQEKVFPMEVSQFISVGERSGNIDEMLESLASYYEEEFDAVVGGLTTVIEPLMIVVVGGLIGAMVVALYLPIFSAGDLVG